LKASNAIVAHRPDSASLLMELRDRRPENFKRLERSEAIERNNLLLTIANPLTPALISSNKKRRKACLSE
jgi:hypothetical protein